MEGSKPSDPTLFNLVLLILYSHTVNGENSTSCLISHKHLVYINNNSMRDSVIDTRKPQIYKVVILSILILNVMGDIISQGVLKLQPDAIPNTSQNFKHYHTSQTLFTATSNILSSTGMEPSSGLVNGIFYHYYWDNSR